MRKFLVWFILPIAILCVVVVVGASILDTKERPVPPIVAGYNVSQIEVTHRSVQLSVHLWYPTTSTGTPELIGQNALFYGAYVYRNADAPAQALPLVVISHGSGGNAPGLSWLAADLANKGMIVVATNHPGTTSGDSDPFQTVNVWERPQDMTALIDYVLDTKPNGILADPDRIATLGFSLGGHSALSLSGIEVSKDRFITYCEENAGLIDCGWMQEAGVDFAAIDADLYEQSNKDPRVMATVAVDPALPLAVKRDGTANLDTEPLIINLGDIADVPAAMRADTVAAQTEGATFVTIPGAWHFSFLAECSGLGNIIIGVAGDDNICSDQGMRDRGIIHTELQALIGDFLSDRLGAQALAQ
jgi:predicted dienelactone hydrolase